MSRKPLAAAAAIVLIVLASLAIALHLFVGSLDQRARNRVVAALSDRFDADVSIRSLHLSLLPKPHVEADDISVRHKRLAGPKPLLSIRHLYASTGFLTALGTRQKVDFVRLEGFAIHIPPRRQAAGLGASPEQSSGRPAEQPPKRLRFTIGEIVADGTTLEIAPKVPGKDPLLFMIQRLTLRRAGNVQPMRFSCVLQNAKPPGLVTSSGSFGPWAEDDPDNTPVNGSYTFEHADLAVFKGISGTLFSQGSYGGALGRLDVNGTTDTPDFALKRGGDPVRLQTKFHALVDGTNGDTVLEPVDARFLSSRFLCSGGVVRKPGESGKTVSLLARTEGARMEDILMLVLGSQKTPLTGDVDFTSKIVIPPGHEDVLDKLQLDGGFAISSALFTSPEAERRLTTLSLRARGIDKDEAEKFDTLPRMVASDLKGEFKLERGLASFSALSFEVPGAEVTLTGGYNLRSQAIDMKGLFRMQATLSDTQSGIKHVLLKPLDPLFRKNGAGLEVPISIGGERRKPVIGVSVFRKRFTIR